eukprot:7943969-Karenia_brevis.AAC.1
MERTFASSSNVKRDNVVESNKRANLKANECYLEHIGDSGAGKMIWSERAFEELGNSEISVEFVHWPGVCTREL